MTLDILLERYKAIKNQRGVNLLTKILEERTTRFLENEQDDAILKDVMKCSGWNRLKELSYINKRGHWVIIPPIYSTIYEVRINS